MEWTFGDFLWASLALFFWVIVIWMVISIFTDIIRRDMSGWAKAGWIFLIVLVPFLGMLIYVIARPKSPLESPRFAGSSSSTEQIAAAARLHDEGKITSEEYAVLKQQALHQQHSGPRIG